MTTGEKNTTIRDPAVMRALAHPVRLALLEHLSQRADGATATQCAAVVGLSPSATSYHLRALAKVGMIREAAGRGDGRERVWESLHESYDIASDPDAGPDVIAAEESLVETFLARQNDKVRRYLAAARHGPKAWFDTCTVAERTLVVTVDELKRLLDQINELTDPFTRRARTRPPGSAQEVSFQLRAVLVDQPAE